MNISKSSRKICSGSSTNCSISGKAIPMVSNWSPGLSARGKIARQEEEEFNDWKKNEWELRIKWIRLEFADLRLPPIKFHPIKTSSSSSSSSAALFVDGRQMQRKCRLCSLHIVIIRCCFLRCLTSSSPLPLFSLLLHNCSGPMFQIRDGEAAEDDDDDDDAIGAAAAAIASADVARSRLLFRM